MPAQVPFSDQDVTTAFPEYTLAVPPLGSGTQKVAYRATNAQADDLALKILLWDAISQEDEDQVSAERFRRELLGMASTSCPHIIAIIDGPDVRQIASGNHFWYTEPFLVGGTLRTRLKAGPLPGDEVYALALALLTAVDAMWTEGKFVHRDIKPENIGFLGDGTVVLLDLGIILFTDLSALTESQLRGPGSSKYAAPEQFEIRRLATIDFRTDLFQIGIVLVECLTGRHPFFAIGTDYLHNLTNFDPSTLDHIDMPGGLRSLLPRLLAPEPNGRYRQPDRAIRVLVGGK